MFTLRPLLDEDLDDVADLAVSLWGDGERTLLREERLRSGLIFGVVLRDGGELAGFRYQQPLAAGIAGFGSMAVAPAWRGAGWGRRLVDAHHEAAADYDVFVVFNSDPDPKNLMIPPGAEQFWTACGYEVIERTAASRMLRWRRPASAQL